MRLCVCSYFVHHSTPVFLGLILDDTCKSLACKPMTKSKEKKPVINLKTRVATKEKLLSQYCGLGMGVFLCYPVKGEGNRLRFDWQYPAVLLWVTHLATRCAGWITCEENVASLIPHWFAVLKEKVTSQFFLICKFCHWFLQGKFDYHFLGWIFSNDRNNCLISLPYSSK